jgi:arylsulfatase A-like enzyme
MQRRWIGIVVTVAAVGALMTTTGADPQARCANASQRACRARAPRLTASRPNVVFVLTDDLSWNLVQYMPSVRRMMRDGMTFRQFMVSDPLCCPSRASILTGQLPHNTRVLRNVEPTGGYYAFNHSGSERNSIAVALHQAGYRTGLIGKYFNRYHPAHDGVPPGWDDWFATGAAYQEFNYEINHQGVVEAHGSSANQYFTDVIRRDALDFLSHTPATRPFYLEISTFAPHAPAVPAPRDAARFPHLKAPRLPSFAHANTNPPHWLRILPPLTARQISAIDEEFLHRVQSVQAVDRMIAGVRATLRREGVDRNTYVIFSSDNGYHMGEHGLAAGKTDAFDTDIRVPLIVVGPGVRAHSSAQGLTENIDLAPTFEALAGLKPQAWRDGRSLFGILRHGGRTPRSWRSRVLVEYWRPPNPADRRDPDRHRDAAGDPAGYRVLRTRFRTWVEYMGMRQREFYNRRLDPYEMHNLANKIGASKRRRLDRATDRLADCEGPTCRIADRA